MDRLTEIRSRREKATPGEWSVEDDFLVTFDPVENEYERRTIADTRYFRLPYADANAAFIASAPSDIDWLIARVEALRKLAGRHRYDEDKVCARVEALEADRDGAGS